MSNVYYSPDGNIEIHKFRPDGYLTVDEWDAKLSGQHISRVDTVTRIDVIKQLLIDIDAASIRPLRAIARGNPCPEEMTRLNKLGEYAEELRNELNGYDHG